MFKHLLLFFTFSNLFSQSIHFTVKDEQGIAVPTSNALFKEKGTNAILEFTKIQEGLKVYQLKKKYTSLLIEVQSTSYFSETITLENLIEDKVYNFNVVLKKNRTIIVEDVVIF